MGWSEKPTKLMLSSLLILTDGGLREEWYLVAVLHYLQHPSLHSHTSPLRPRSSQAVAYRVGERDMTPTAENSLLSSSSTASKGTSGRVTFRLRRQLRRGRRLGVSRSRGLWNGGGNFERFLRHNFRFFGWI